MQQQPDLDAIIQKYGGTVAPPPTPVAQGVDLDAIIKRYGGTTTPTKARKSAAFKGLVEHYATQAGLDPELVYRVIDAESNGNPKAVSPKKAKGLMQLMDATAAEYAVSDPFDPEQNIRAGTSYLKKLLDQYGGDEAKALAAYNAGPTAVNKHNGVPPYPETQAYVAKITAGRGGQQAPPAPTPAGSDLDIVSYTPDEAPAEAAPSGPIQPRAQGVTDQTPRIGPQTTLGKIKEGVGDFVQNFPPLRMIQGAANAVKTAGDEVVSGLPQMARGIAQLTPAGSAIPGMNTVIRPSQTPEQYAKGLNDLAEGSMKVGAPLIIPALASNPAFTAAMIAAATVASDQAVAFAKRAGWGEEYQRLAGNAAALTTLGLGGKRLTGAALRGVESMARDVGVKIGQRIKQAPPEAARGLEPPTMEAEVVAGGRGPQRPPEAPTGEPAGQAEIAGYPAPVPPEARPIPVTAEEGNWPPRQEPVAPEAAVAPAQPEPPPPPPVAPVQPEPPAPEVPVAPPISPSPAQAENVIRPPSEIAPEPVAPVEPAKPVATKTGDYIQVDARQIKVAPKVYQFKESDAEGVTGALRNVAEWDELQGRATPVVLHQTTDGTLYVADGHQRVNLAQRLLAQGKPVPPLNTVVYREADGYTAADMRRVAALVNVRQDSATAVDIAKLLREGPLSEQEQATIPKNNVRGERFAQAQELTKLSDPAFQAVVNGEIPAAQAQFVGRHVTNPAQQVAAIRALAKADLPNAYQAERFVKELVRDTFATETQLDMFGEHHVAFSLAKEKAQVLDAVKRALSSQKSAFGNALRNQAKLEGAGNVLDADANARLASEAGRFQALLDVFADKSGYTQAALRDAARRVHDRELSPADAVDAVIAALERDFRGDPPPSAVPSPAPESGGGRPSDGRGVGSESGGDRGPDEVLPVSRAELEAAGQSSMFGEEPAAPPVASPKLAESKAAFDAAKGPDSAPLEPGRVVTNEFGEGDRMLPGRMEELAGKLNEQPVIATPDELGKMIAAQKAKIAEARRRATNINYRVSGPAREALPGLEAGLVELEKLAGIKKPEDAKLGDLLADAPNGLDAYAMRHLDKWLEDTVREDERDRLKNRIVDLLADHPEMIDRGWPALRDIVESIYDPAPNPPARPKVIEKTTLDELPNPNGRDGPFRLVRQEKDNGDVFYSVLHTAQDGVQFGQSFATEADARAWRDKVIAHQAERVKQFKESDDRARAEGKATQAQRESSFRYIERQRNKGWARGNFAQAYWDFLQGERDTPDPAGIGPMVRFDIIAELTRIAGKPAPSKAEAARDDFASKQRGRKKGRRK